MTILSVDAGFGNLSTVIKFVNENLNVVNLKKRHFFNINLAVEEIYINIVKFAYPNKNGKVEIHFNFQESPVCFTITFIDWGIPYDPIANFVEPDIKLDVNKRKLGGLGLFLVKNVTSKVKYQYVSGKNILSLSFLCD